MKNSEETKSLSIEDIRPIESEKDGALGSNTIRAIQCAVNAFEQGFANLKLISDLGKSPLESVRKDPKILVSGYAANAIYQGVCSFPSLTINQYLDPSTSKYVKAGISTSLEVLVGVPLEICAAKKALKEVGKDISSNKEFLNSSKMIFLPFMAKSYLGWLVINDDTSDLPQKVIHGGFSGLLSSPIDSFSNSLIKESSLSKSIVDTYKQAFNSMNLKTVIKSAPYRGAAGAFSAVVLSKQFGEVLRDVLDPLYQSSIKEKSNLIPNAQINQRFGEDFIEKIMLENER